MEEDTGNPRAHPIKHTTDHGLVVVVRQVGEPQLAD